MAHKEELLQRPLYIYNLPPEILSTLSAKSDLTLAEQQAQPEGPGTSSIPTETSSTNCTLCGFTGRTVNEQRTHVRSDHHKLNMKRKIRGQRPLSEAEFEKTLADIEEGESISGSADSESEADIEVDGDFNAAARRKRGINPASNATRDTNQDEDEKDEESLKKGNPKTPLLWFKSSILPPTVSLGIYRAVLPADISDHPTYLATKQLQPTSNPPANPPHFFLCMIGGGHFAAMVISLIPQPSNKPGERTATVLAHKTFHRYTTRRKQGGAQSANDAAKGNAHSAGSNLRRYNEAELTKDIRELLASWKTEWIDTAELMFIRAAGTTNRRTIFHYEGAVLNSKDPRIRGFPFSTRRATQGELMRAFLELTRLKISRVSQASLSATTESLAGLRVNPRPERLQQSSGPRTLKPTTAERELLDHTSTIISLIRRSKVPPLMTYLSANSLSSDFTFYPRAQHFHAPTLLHLAASVNSPAIVTALLTKLGADPTVKNEEGKTPFDFAGERPTRDAFRLARSELGENRWDWAAAKVTSPLTPADIAARTEAEAAAKRAREEREAERRKNEAARLKKEEEEKSQRERRSAALRGEGGVKLGGVGAAQRLRTGDDLGREREAAGMTPEMRMRLERERRARAAEARIKAMQGGSGGS